jgi:glycine/D-amino acid oxidase-like deaminating enzyme/nitrite reductase/ring-hydroxylating ferredoxin subunit
MAMAGRIAADTHEERPVEAESGHTTSIWHSTIGDMSRPPLNAPARADVCVVGAGIAGMMTAYLLSRAGRRVIVLDDGPIGGGETGRTTAHLSDALDDRYVELERVHGADGARLAAHSHRCAIDLLERIAEEESIDCGFTRVDGFLFPADEEGDGEDGRARLREEYEAARRAGVAVEEGQQAPYAPFAGTHCLRFARQARFHPLQFVAGLAARIEANQGRIHTGTRVTGVTGGSPVRVETEAGHTVLASACVVATNSPMSDAVVTHAKQAPYRTFAIAARVPKGAVPDALYWEDADPYIYIRLQHGGSHDWVIVGGEDYKTGQKDDDAERVAELERWTRDRFPMVESVDHHWSGQVLEPSDGLAFIGRNPDGAENVYIITGDSGHGMTHGAIGGMLTTDLILGRQNPWAQLYEPKRLKLRAAGELAKENLNVAAQYAAWVLPGDVRSAEAVTPGTGRVVRRGATMVAVFCDSEGQLHERSAVCTHLKCIVNWNDLEKSWDCPCHGSRFDPYGQVLNGPAADPLGEA